MQKLHTAVSQVLTMVKPWLQKWWQRLGRLSDRLYPGNQPPSRGMRIFTSLLVMGMMSLVLGLVIVMLIFRHYSSDLPSTDQLANYSPPVVTRLYTSNSKLLAEYATEKRFFVPLSAIPDRVKQAFVSAEDRNFYSHQGVDLWGITRAMVHNISNIGTDQSMMGGSTITQQVVKNFLLTSEKSLERKVKEAILAYRISGLYSKEKILELYLNQIYLGRGTYGVAAAAVNFFNKSLDELTIEEAAMLAAMPKAPAYYDPAHNYDQALARRNYVIERMREDGAISDEEAASASKAAILLREKPIEEVTRADFFAEEVRRQLRKMYGFNVLYEGGLYVKTTVDPTFQDYADRALRHALRLYDERHGYRGPLANLKNDIGKWQPALQALQDTRKFPLYDAESLAIVLQVDAKSAQLGLLGKGRGNVNLEGVRWARKQLSDTRVGGPIARVSDVLTVGDVIVASPLEKGKSVYQLRQIPAVNGAMVVIDPHIEKVLAMGGG